LLALLLLFFHEHMGCIQRALGGDLTHMITVPSTRGRAGQHPLSGLVGNRLGLPKLSAIANAAYGRDEREPHTDWFAIESSRLLGTARVLILDDTWTSGARTQSLAYALKRAGVAATVVVVLGRHVNPDDEQSHALLDAIKDSLFEPSHCALDDFT
jgi:hypothetical protein